MLKIKNYTGNYCCSHTITLTGRGARNAVILEWYFCRRRWGKIVIPLIEQPPSVKKLFERYFYSDNLGR